MRRLVAALILLAAPGAAEPPDGQPAIPPELLVPNEEARVFFDALQSHILTDEVMARLIQAMPGASPRPMDDVIDRLFSSGEAVPNWQSLGINERAAIRAHEGGMSANMTQGTDAHGPTYGYYVDRPIESLIPREWVLIARRGEPFVDASVQTGISHASAKVILVERLIFRRQGNAGCRVRAESRLYADPSVPATQADMIATVFGMRFLAAVEHRSFCQVVEDLGQGQYRARFFDGEGHSLPAFDQVSLPFRIVPFRPASGSTAPR
jgi:hypothetical protein